jgi:Helicase associated domain
MPLLLWQLLLPAVILLSSSPTATTTVDAFAFVTLSSSSPCSSLVLRPAHHRRSGTNDPPFLRGVVTVGRRRTTTAAVDDNNVYKNDRATTDETTTTTAETTPLSQLEQEEQQHLHPVLRQLVPHLRRHQERYGNANIPLGSSSVGGRQCATLRRLRVQGRLRDEHDVRYMNEHFPTFIWHSLEDVYEQHEFEPLFQRLLSYGDDYSPPKKYPADPELGAWVTALRRLYRIDRVDPDHAQRLNDIGFAWTTPRQCGSQFMIRYRQVVAQYGNSGGGYGDGRSGLTPPQDVVFDASTVQWIQAQQRVHETLSPTRQQYLRQLLGRDDWQHWQPATSNNNNNNNTTTAAAVATVIVAASLSSPPAAAAAAE